MLRESISRGKRQRIKKRLAVLSGETPKETEKEAAPKKEEKP